MGQAKPRLGQAGTGRKPDILSNENTVFCRVKTTLGQDGQAETNKVSKRNKTSNVNMNNAYTECSCNLPVHPVPPVPEIAQTAWWLVETSCDATDSAPTSSPSTDIEVDIIVDTEVDTEVVTEVVTEADLSDADLTAAITCPWCGRGNLIDDPSGIACVDCRDLAFVDVGDAMVRADQVELVNEDETYNATEQRLLNHCHRILGMCQSRLRDPATSKSARQVPCPRCGAKLARLPTTPVINRWVNLDCMTPGCNHVKPVKLQASEVARTRARMTARDTTRRPWLFRVP
jgi:hypothetical protein